MNKVSTFFFIISCALIFNSCFKADNIEPEEVMFEKVTDVKSVLPFETISFGGSKFPGIIDDYKLLIGTVEAPVVKKTPDSLYAFVPLDVQVGKHEVTLIHKGINFNIGDVEIIDWQKVSQYNISFFDTKNKEYPYQITDAESNSIIPHISGGKMDKIYLASKGGETSIIELNEQGLPSRYFEKEKVFVFNGYDFEKGKVNIAEFHKDSIDEVTFKYGVSVDLVKINEVKNIDKFYNNIKGNTGENVTLGTADVSEMFNHIGTVFEITACLVGVATAVVAPITTFFTGAGLVVTCASAVYSAVKIINPKQDNVVGSQLQTVHSIKMGLIDCLGMAVKKPKNAKDLYDGIYACYALTLEAAKGVNTLYQEFKAAQARDLAKIDAILGTGYGDIKITLDWNTTADLDLWVIDKYGKKIFWRDTKSTDGYGKLDLDDTNGFGPENVYWATDRAPFGAYKVQVHYYGPSGGSNTSYRVIINNFGRSKTFKGTIGYNQVVTIATFTTNTPWNKIERNNTDEKVEFAIRQLLPEKL